MVSNCMPIIVNPRAGAGGKDRVIEQFRQAIRETDWVPEIHYTHARGHAVELSRNLVLNGSRCLCCMGGDGTAFEVINGIMQSGYASDVRLGILPLGTGNSFLRDYSITSWQQVADCICQNSIRKVDIGKVHCQGKSGNQTIFFHNVVGFGMMARGCQLRHTSFRFFGKFGYHAAFFYMLPNYKPYEIRLRVDGKSQEIETPILAVCNSQYTGHNMRLSPLSSVEDGKLDILYTNPVSSWRILQLFASLPTGNHLNHPAVHLEQAKSVTIEVQNSSLVMIDGELEGHPPMEIALIPSALEIFS